MEIHYIKEGTPCFTGNQEKFKGLLVDEIKFQKSSFKLALEKSAKEYNRKNELFSVEELISSIEKEIPVFYTKINHGFWNQLVFITGFMGLDNNKYAKLCTRYFTRHKKGILNKSASCYSKYVCSNFAYDLHNLLTMNSQNKNFRLGVSIDNGTLDPKDIVNRIESIYTQEAIAKKKMLDGLSFLVMMEYTKSFSKIYPSNLFKKLCVHEKLVKFQNVISTKKKVFIGPVNTLDALPDGEDILKIEIPLANNLYQDIYYNADLFVDNIKKRIKNFIKHEYGVVLMEAGPFAPYLISHLSLDDMNISGFDTGMALVSLFNSDITKGSWRDHHENVLKTI